MLYRAFLKWLEVPEQRPEPIGLTEAQQRAQLQEVTTDLVRLEGAILSCSSWRSIPAAWRRDQDGLPGECSRLTGRLRWLLEQRGREHDRLRQLLHEGPGQD